MKFVLGTESLQTEFKFDMFKKDSKLPLIHNKLQKVDNIGIYLSGGLDSAALLCLILTELKSTNKQIPVYCFTVIKNDYSEYYAKQVITEVEKRFDIKLIHVTNVPNDDTAILLGNISSTAMKFVNNYVSNIFSYMAINHMPPEHLVKFNNKLTIQYPTQFSYNYPFLNLHKFQIIDLIYKLNCEWIIALTQSCTQLKEGQCGKCYSCEERAWGFKMLEKQDPAIS